MKQKRMGCLAVALLLTGMALAGCVGSEAGGDQAPADADVNQDDDSSTDTGATDGNQTDPGDLDDGSDGNETEEETSYRVPVDAMSAEPAETQEGMAKFLFDTHMDEVGYAYSAGLAGHNTGVHEYEIHNPGDVTFFDIYLSQPDAQGGQDADMDLYVKNESGSTVASAASPTSDEYVFYQPPEGVSQNFTVTIDPWLNPDSTGTVSGSYQLEVWVWTHEDWSADHPFTDVWTKEYDFGQLEVCPDQDVYCVSGIAWSGDYTGTTEDGEFNLGGYAWNGCGTNGGGPGTLPCPPEDPYKKVSFVIDDDVAGQQVAAIFATCSNDGDIYCGETENINDSKTDDNSPYCDRASCKGPNELTATFCGVVNGLTRDGTTDHDGTGPGMWDQRGEEYQKADGTYAPHPGVTGVNIFLVGPQRGGGGICPNANPYTGPTTGTITLIAQN